jgi:hypothetical protein
MILDEASVVGTSVRSQALKNNRSVNSLEVISSPILNLEREPTALSMCKIDSFESPITSRTSLEPAFENQQYIILAFGACHRPRPIKKLFEGD